MAKKVLIVLAHEERKSLNVTMTNWMVDILQEFGHEVKVSDLYAQNFDPVTKRKDFTDLSDDVEHIVYSTYAGECYKRNTLAPYIMEETEKLTWADLIILQFPMYWYSVPAILKGWIDKVLINEYAFDFATGRILDNGIFKDKKVWLSLTTGCDESMFTSKGIAGDMNINLWPIQYTFGICGMQLPRPLIVYSANYIKKEFLEEAKAEVRRRLSGIFEEKTMEFLPLRSFTYPGGELIDEYDSADQAPAVGQHMGKPILDSQFVL